MSSTYFKQRVERSEGQKAVTHFRSREESYGLQRRGVRGDLKKVLATERPDIREEPMVEKPAELITSVKYYGDREADTPADAMTANAAALYEYAMAHARLEMKERDEHLISFADVKAYLGVEKSSRIREYVDALSSTWVSYDFLDQGVQRIGRRIQLMQCEEVVLQDGSRHLSFVMHPSVRKVIAAARQYTHLELGAFPRFSSKYTARIYPKLALYAGRDVRHPLVYTPEQLADELGWKPSGAFRFSNFESRCLRPVIDDIKAHVRRFGIEIEYRHAPTRGRPVTAIVITVGEMRRVIEEAALAPMSKSDRTKLRRRAKDRTVDIADEMPGDSALRQAATASGISVTVLAAQWIDAVSTDTEVQKRIREVGATEAFLEWSQTAEEEIDFDRVAVIRMRLTDETDPAFVKKDVIPFLKRTVGWTGSVEKVFRLEWKEGTSVVSQDFRVPCSQSDVEMLFSHYSQIFEEAEFLK
ncbi:replication initiation protein [Gellertiella hungarica]|uniref:Initiator Rep protein WH1 domain-containing protein n=1 Tax=Gellertiella hungarica TaxID=1572859 RepID=A0A7W6J3D1_9HYPH|nr:replication initiation protein [Gellertiella hungarica]MBB4064019.1 hypothetical protein [Gellertiella hungarica]